MDERLAPPSGGPLHDECDEPVSVATRRALLERSARALLGKEVFDPLGAKIGVVEDVIYEVRSFEPRWAVVRRGPFRRRDTLVPLRFRYGNDDGPMVVVYDKHTVLAGPTLERHRMVSAETVAALVSYYGR